MFYPKPSTSFSSRDFPIFPRFQHLQEDVRAFYRWPAELDPTGLSRFDTLSLPLPDKFPFLLRYIAENLQYQVSYQRPGQVTLLLPGIQQGDVENHNGDLLFFGDNPPVF